MRAAIPLLVLLLSMCGAQTQSTPSEVQPESQGTGGVAAAAEVSTQLDVSAELKELRDMVVELRVMLRYTQDDVKVLEAEVEVLGTDNIAMKQRLAVSETKVDALEADNVAMTQRLAVSEAKVEVLEAENEVVKERLVASECKVEVLEAENVAMKQWLAVSDSKVEVLEKALQDTKAEMKTEVDNLKNENAAQEAELTAVKTRLAATETDVENLEKEIRAAPKVAFSAALRESGSGYIESGSNDLNLVFSKVITNVGEAYSNTTGFFTAPVRGVYFFRFTVMDTLDSRSMFIRMNKNGERYFWLYEYDTDGKGSYLSSGLTLQLEKGDVVNMVLPASYRLYEYSTSNHCTFSGFLLFPL